MSQEKFIQAYDLEEAIAASARNMEHKGKLTDAVDSVMKVRIDKPKYSTHQIDIPGLVGFGRPGYGTAYPNTEDFLILSMKRKGIFSWGRKKPALGLRYFVYDLPNIILIDYVQTPANVSLNSYLKMQEALGARPHEFLVAHFLARLRPVLNYIPQAKVAFSSSASRGKVYAALRDRFLDRHYILNHNKERVREILGEDNAWIKARTSGAKE